MKKIILSQLLILLAFASTSVAQSVNVLAFKHYDKIVKLDEGRVDAWFPEYIKRNQTLINNQKLAYSEFLFFKEKIKEGNKYGRYVKVDNLRYYTLTSDFSDLYYGQEGSAAFKTYIDSGVRKKDVKKLMDVRGSIISGFIDAIIATQKTD